MRKLFLTTLVGALAAAGLLLAACKATDTAGNQSATTVQQPPAQPAAAEADIGTRRGMGIVAGRNRGS